MRQNSPERTVILGNVEGSMKRGWPYIRWVDSVKEAFHQLSKFGYWCAIEMLLTYATRDGLL